MNEAVTEDNTTAVDRVLNFETVLYFGNVENEEGRFEWTIMADTVTVSLTASPWWEDVDLVLMISVTVIAVTAIIAVVVIVYLRQGDRMKRMPE